MVARAQLAYMRNSLIMYVTCTEIKKKKKKDKTMESCQMLYRRIHFIVTKLRYVLLYYPYHCNEDASAVGLGRYM